MFIVTFLGFLFFSTFNIFFYWVFIISIYYVDLMTLLKYSTWFAAIDKLQFSNQQMSIVYDCYNATMFSFFFFVILI